MKRDESRIKPKRQNLTPIPRTHAAKGLPRFTNMKGRNKARPMRIKTKTKRKCTEEGKIEKEEEEKRLARYTERRKGNEICIKRKLNKK